MEYSEKKRGIFSHTIIYSFGNFLARGLNFILLPFYSHYISPSEFGIYSVIVSVLTIASTILNFGLPGIFVKNLSETGSQFEKKKFISNVISSVILLSIPVLVIVIIFSGQLSQLIIGNENFGLEIILGIISIYVLNFSYYFSVFYVAEENSKKYVFINSVGALINFILNIILIVVFNSGINGIFLSQIFSSLIIILLAKDVFKNFFTFEVDLRYLKPILVVSFPLLLSGIFTIVVELIDRLLVLKFLGEDQAGIYSFGYRLALIYNLFILSFKSAWIPHYFNLKNISNEEEARHLGRVFTKLVFISAILILSIQILIKILFEFDFFAFRIFDPKYSASQELIVYVMIGYFFSLMMAFYSIAPYKFNKTIHFLLADLLAMLINLILNFLLIPMIGIKGAAIATMIAFFIGAVYLFFYSKKRIRVTYEISKVALIVLISILTFTTYFYFKNILSTISFLLFLILIGIKWNLFGKKTFKLLV
ncbi:MAG: oligosaccharide flippase family protein [Ignavibacteria bacterium]|jgi:O-antigen/teichoic acid export membrane protein|nr:oligosaccharide flippase family protein [Ignavibacteria bacterium]MDH7527356.1 oligosaccharide flippase family protein [Ignavibacteria bacterium]